MSYSRVYSFERVSPIHLVGNTGQSIQISIHPPSQYICTNREQIFPDWKNTFSLWIAIVLQQARFELVDTTPEIEMEKERLREKFMRFGCDVAFNLRDRDYQTDIIDPRTGYPLLSRPGKKNHDDTATVKALLQYAIVQNKCRVLVHPEWGTAVYPSILISEAPPSIMEWIIKSIAPLHDWKLKVSV